MEQSFIESNIGQLQTPVGCFRVFSDTDGTIPFSVVKNPYNVPFDVINEHGEKTGTITTDTNYQILIDTSLLEVGRDYRIEFSEGRWEFIDSDENTMCCGTIIGDWAVGIGAYDPNNDEKEDQVTRNWEATGIFREPDRFDETGFTEYSVDTIDAENGFRFKLIDHSAKMVHFEVAWVKMDQYPIGQYESALGLWLC